MKMNYLKNAVELSSLELMEVTGGGGYYPGYDRDIQVFSALVGEFWDGFVRGVVDGAEDGKKQFS